MKAKAIVFDIDGTLSPEVSWTTLTRSLYASVEDHLRIYQNYKEGHSTYEKSKQQLLTLWQETGNATRPIFLSLFEQIPLVPNAPAIIDKLREKYRLCIITGSMDLYARAIADKLGIRDYYANTTLYWDEGQNLIDMDYELNQAKRKLDQFLEYCAAQGVSPAECIVVGDGDNDISLFQSSKKGVAVGHNIPDELRAVAWKTIEDIEELTTFL